MSKRIIFIILLVLIPLNLLIAQDFVKIDGAGNKVLVEYIGYDYDVVIPNDIY
jgi:hypothetical protein